MESVTEFIRKNARGIARAMLSIAIPSAQIAGAIAPFSAILAPLFVYAERGICIMMLYGAIILPIVIFITLFLAWYSILSLGIIIAIAERNSTYFQ